MENLMKKTFALLLSISMLSACTTYDAYTGEEKASKTSVGAGIGAGVAAVIAYLDTRNERDSGERNRKILAAATGGAAIGGGIGYYMDAQEAKLRRQLRGSGVSVERVGDNINLIMPGNITFGSAQSDIAASFYDVLDSVALVVDEYNRTIIVVAGHTDSDGSDSYNQELSEQRAQSVGAYLRSKGVNEVRLDVVGFGESQPIATNTTAAGKQENRRVEITLLPVE
jgi:outer membrane protein OmpA-like peptidoglycan-associated protein